MADNEASRSHNPKFIEYHTKVLYINMLKDGTVPDTRGSIRKKLATQLHAVQPIPWVSETQTTSLIFCKEGDNIGILRTEIQTVIANVRDAPRAKIHHIAYENAEFAYVIMKPIYISKETDDKPETLAKLLDSMREKKRKVRKPAKQEVDDLIDQIQKTLKIEGGAKIEPTTTTTTDTTHDIEFVQANMGNNTIVLYINKLKSDGDEPHRSPIRETLLNHLHFSRWISCTQRTSLIFCKNTNQTIEEMETEINRAIDLTKATNSTNADLQTCYRNSEIPYVLMTIEGTSTKLEDKAQALADFMNMIQEEEEDEPETKPGTSSEVKEEPQSEDKSEDTEPGPSTNVKEEPDSE